MKRFFVIILLALLAACASAPISNQLETAYNTVDAYREVTLISLQRGRITPDQAAAASAKARAAVAKIDAARAALKACLPPATCTEYLTLMQSLQPSLYELEAELRKQQGAAK